MFTKKAMRNRPFLAAPIFLCLLLVLAGFIGEKAYQTNNGPPSAAKSIIFMVPDGMGLADITAARIFKYGQGGGNLYLETLSTIG